MNIDFINHEEVECDRVGLSAGTMLPNSQYLDEFRNTLEKYSIRKVRAQGVFYGKRHKGVRFWLKGVDVTKEMEEELSALVETYEYLTVGNEARCQFFPWPKDDTYVKDDEIVYEDGIFYANGFYSMVEQHNSLVHLEVDEIRGMLEMYASKNWEITTNYRLCKIYKCLVALFCKEGFVDYLCPEYAESVQPEMKLFRRLCVGLENDIGRSLSREITLFIRTDVLDKLFKAAKLEVRESDRFDRFLLDF